MEQNKSKSIFSSFPDHIWLIAEAHDDGLYSIHSKVHPNGKCKTFPERVNLRDALTFTTELQQILGLPDDAVLISANKAVMNAPDVTNRRLKRYLEGR
ncbi:hypothetical protein [Paenibacillus sp. MBLB4367]|uniref:hypothetical protein n=1 Tax=Paenibacillus sp. MBLB4367 TaxID=3384767 RepID=UPI00390821B8